MTILAITGVPGTGKTTVADQLGDRFTVVDAGDLARQADAITRHDAARGADVVDEDRLAKRARELLPEGDVIVEGVLAHHADPDAVVLLRCHPTELGHRLATRDWPDAKVEENVMAETLDALVPEITTDPAWEIDTTDLDPATVARYIAALINGDPVDTDAVQPPGTADWTDTLLGEDGL